MSADNGIYILVTASKSGNPNEKEYRVCECMAIDNIADLDLGLFVLVDLFGDKQVFSSRVAALEEADKIYQKIMEYDGILEYGISFINYGGPFPDITIEEAKQKIRDYYKSKGLGSIS